MAKNRAEMRGELKRIRRDAGMILHEANRYNEVIDEALREAPFRLWVATVDTSVSTSSSVKGYSLAGIADLDIPGQVQRVEMEDSYGDAFLEIGRCEVVDDEGVLTLRLDEYPPEAGRTLRVHFKALPALAASVDSATVPIDEDWVAARGAVILLGEADPRFEDAGQIGRDLGYWSGRLFEREAELGRRRGRMVRSARTQVW